MRREWIIVAVLCATAAAAVLGGYLAGRHSVTGPFATLIDYHAKAATLGGLLADDSLTAALTARQRQEFYKAYSGGATIEDHVNEISWSVANTPTPFVGSAPWPGQQHNAFINGYQFRHQADLQQPKPAGVVRIFLTGGSTAFGSGAPAQNQTIGSLLERLLNAAPAEADLRYEVMTFANPAWASTHERIAIGNRLSELEPDLVISFSGNNDVFWGHAGRNVFWFRTLAEELYWELIKTAYRSAGRTPPPNVVAIDDEPVAPARVAGRLSKNIRLSAYALALQEIPYVFVLQPTLAASRKPTTPREKDFLRDQAMTDYYRKAYAGIRRQLQDLDATVDNLTTLDLSTVFDQMTTADELFIDSFHFADKGNAAIARAIAEDAAFRAVLLSLP